MSFASYAGLRDRNRESLEPNPEEDDDLYVDLGGAVQECFARFTNAAPKLVIMGAYGTGKTHLLHVLMKRMDRKRFAPVYVKLDAFGKWAESRHLHDAILSALLEKRLLIPAIRGVSAKTELQPDVRHAFALLLEDETNALARAWLLGRGPTPTQALKAKFSAPLFTHARGVAYSRIWRVLADGLKRETDRELMLLIDESETFQDQVDASRAADMGVAVREMFDSANRSYGVAMGLTAPKLRSRHPLMRDDVESRVRNVILSLRDVSDAADRLEFINGLLGKLFDQPRGFISDVAVATLVQHGPTWARRNAGAEREPVQREYVKLLDRLAKDAWHQDINLPLTSKVLRQLNSGQLTLLKADG